MDKFARYYAWFLLVATALPALARLGQARNLAVLTSERISDQRRRALHRKLGWLSFIGSFILIPAYFYFSHQRWMIVAFVIGIITGIEMIGNTASPEPDSLTRQNRYFGIAYAACAIGTYVFLLRK